MTKYRQYRINIPEKMIKKLGWGKEDKIIIFIESRNGKKRIVLKNKDY